MILKFILIILIIILGLCQFLFNKYIYNQSVSEAFKNEEVLNRFFSLHFFPFALIPRSIAQIIAYFTLFCWCLWSLYQDLFHNWDFFHSYTTFSLLAIIMFFHAISLLYIQENIFTDDK